MRTHILIQRGEQPSAPGPAECFTGAVRIEHLFPPMFLPARPVLPWSQTGGKDRMAQPSAGADADSHLRQRIGAGVERTGAGSPPRRCGLVSARCQTLAWGRQQQPHDAYFHLRGVGRKKRLLDGKGQ